MNKFHVIIPARMHSTRLPHKMTLSVGKYPLIIQTAKQAQKSEAYQVTVATDHLDIADLCKDHDINAILTKNTHTSGTERLVEAAEILELADNEIVINIQGDEPLIEPVLINELARFLTAKLTNFATIAHKIDNEEEIFNPHVTKVVLDNDSNALYFSRSPIPFYRDGFTERNHNFQLPPKLDILRHVGVYAYHVAFLKQYSKMLVSPLEQTEMLEQLRALYNGYKIAVLVSDIIPATGVDTLEDLQRIRQLLHDNNNEV